MACLHLSEQATHDGEFNTHYEKVSSELRRGTVVVISAGHLVVIEAFGEHNDSSPTTKPPPRIDGTGADLAKVETLALPLLISFESDMQPQHHCMKTISREHQMESVMMRRD
ncbi:hypothetical protein L1987_86388 [Smallanthus sonchifolius]|uniref:Uncharacterized protein n=1 Tax=Smallanthus sonchifolius TaxID=185202 RepID=A0ACB8Y3D2_9ASTR|nr:hypothetical protein L1987_86388 [Smallanthus sonchifolius]